MADLFENEVWKDIKGYENLYQVSNMGRVRNVKRNCIKALQSNFVNDYLFVSLGRKSRKNYVHRLVYETFVGYKNSKSLTNHINGNKRDNRIENLEECDYSYNLKYAWCNGERRLKPVSAYNLNGVFIKTYNTAKQASEELKVSRAGICNCCKGKRKNVKGFIFKYTNE